MECIKCKYEGLIAEVLYDNWERAYEGDYDWTSRGGTYNTFHAELSNGGTVETIDKHNTESWGPGYGDGEYMQGSEFDAWLVLKVVNPDGTELFFRKEGTANSYGNVSWHKPLRQVKIVEKVVQVFENIYEAV